MDLKELRRQIYDDASEYTQAALAGKPALDSKLES